MGNIGNEYADQLTKAVTGKNESPCRSARLQLSGSHCNSSSTEAGVLVAHHRATARPLPKVVRTITDGRLGGPPLLNPEGKREPAYLYDCLSSVNSRFPPEGLTKAVTQNG
ncbi:hypothetical protein AVEN_186662-1 [Araneus ventricosus]|uniref:Uncharacterized protein n=1 Tax=Araneus ventricosus TaxID=182803 RepID=A0A4Y2J7S1_ARAVE|nr:hypothetical protein AVEN_186662-1 [Araneus ventricosus]